MNAALSPSMSHAERGKLISGCHRFSEIKTVSIGL